MHVFFHELSQYNSDTAFLTWLLCFGELPVAVNEVIVPIPEFTSTIYHLYNVNVEIVKERDSDRYKGILSKTKQQNGDMLNIHRILHFSRSPYFRVYSPLHIGIVLAQIFYLYMPTFCLILHMEYISFFRIKKYIYVCLFATVKLMNSIFTIWQTRKYHTIPLPVVKYRT